MDDVISSYLNNEKAECDYFPFGKEILYLNEVLRNPDLLKPDLKPF